VLANESFANTFFYFVKLQIIYLQIICFQKICYLTKGTCYFRDCNRLRLTNRQGPLAALHSDKPFPCWNSEKSWKWNEKITDAWGLVGVGTLWGDQNPCQ